MDEYREDIVDDAREAELVPLDGKRLWEDDEGTLPEDARRALLQLVRGPYIHEREDAALWRALINYLPHIRSRLADLFLELCLDLEAGVAFAKNAHSEERALPKAARSLTMTLLDTVMVLMLRKELQVANSSRVFIGQTDLFEQMGQYRNLTKHDQAGFLAALKTSWNRMVENRLLIKSDVEDRYEISPVLKIVFGAEEAAAVAREFERMRGAGAAGAAGQAASADGAGHAQPVESSEEGRLFDVF